jgi:putative protease
MTLSPAIEIMSPVGSYESLMAAIQGGAGSVYLGVGKLNMRSKSTQNFTLKDLEKITSICRENRVRCYITLNAVIFDEEMDEMKAVLEAAAKNGVSAIIASDQAVIQQANAMGMEVHLSTQNNITNTAAVKYYSRYADVMVTARELRLEQVAAITRAIRELDIRGPSGNPVRIEVFAHGALCMAVSGKCYLSLDNYNFSANRGECLQLCRRGYRVLDRDGEYELEIDNEYIMSPRDLKTIDFLDKIIGAGVSILKIEGRGRSPEYVNTVTRCYHEAVDAVLDGTFTGEKIAGWNERLVTVYNRGFWDGYYLGRKMGEWSGRYGSQATKRKIYVGKVTNYFSKMGVAEIKIESHGIGAGEEFLITGPTTGVYEGTFGEIRVDMKNTGKAGKGDSCSIPVNSLVRRGDKVFKVVDARSADLNPEEPD